PTVVPSATDVRVTADGNYVVADIRAGALFKVTPDGQISVIHRGPPFSRAGQVPQEGGPRGVVLDNDGNAILVDEVAKSLFAVSPDATVSTIYSGPPLCGPSDVTIYKPLPATTLPTVPPGDGGTVPAPAQGPDQTEPGESNADSGEP